MMDKILLIKKEMGIEQVLARDPVIPSILMAQGIERVGIPMMSGMTLEGICIDQDIDADEVTERINEYLRGKAS